MNLIFKEFLQFLKDQNVDTNKYNLKEGYYWFDNQIIKAYDKEGNIHKILRLHIDNKLNISVTDYKNKPFDLESWEETLHRKEEEIIKSEVNSQNLIKEKLIQYKDYIPAVLTSGGKDSIVLDYLVSISTDKKIERIFNNTTLDCADTYKYIKSIQDVQIITPKEGFYQWRKRYNYIPTMLGRACCSIFKEGETVVQLDENKKYLFFMGMRNDESNKRANYGDEWKNLKWGSRDWIGILGIREWTEENIWLYMLKNNLHINSKYRKGYDRVGCAIVCPYQNKIKWLLDQYWYPKMYKRWHDILDKDFIDNKKWLILNCTLEEYHTCWNGGVYRDNPTKEVIEEFATMNNLNLEVAEKYFNHNCYRCALNGINKKIKIKEVIGMNMKFLGRNTNKFFCKKHLIEFISETKEDKYTQEDWNNDVQSFKDQGCTLL